MLRSHCHADYVEQLVQAELRRDLCIITTPHTKSCLAKRARGEDVFAAVPDLGFIRGLPRQHQNVVSDQLDSLRSKLPGIAGKHVSLGPLSLANDVLKAVPQTNCWFLELRVDW